MNLISINDLKSWQVDELTASTVLRSKDVKWNGSNASAILLFAEPSTRTRVSFALAARECGIFPLDLDKDNSSIAKGESLSDTFATLAMYDPTFLIVRHKNGMACQIAERFMPDGTTIINAGSGTTNHPTQALGDARLIRSISSDPTIAIVGDVAHSRVAKSLIQVSRQMGWNIFTAGPPELQFTHGEDDIECSNDIRDIKHAKFVYVIRPQLERMEKDIFNREEYIYNWRIEPKHLTVNQCLMHAGPVNIGLEVSPAALNECNTLIQKQVMFCHGIRKDLFGWLRYA